MMNREILAALNAAGDALAALGEGSIVLGRFSPDLYSDGKPHFTCRLELEGTPGIHASADTFGGALVKAMADREDKRADMAREAEIRAEIEARMAPRKEAA